MNDQDKLKSLLTYVSQDNRVCPEPMYWEQLWRKLPGREKYEMENGNILRPLILAAWWEANDMEKAERLQLQIQYASENGVLNAVDRYLRKLRPENWLTSADDDLTSL
jgi:hypothetical protein